MRRALVAMACGTLAGCSVFSSRPIPETRYYTLSVQGEPPVRLGGAVQIGMFSIDQPYAGERFAYRSSPYAVEYYTYHRWAGSPRTIVAAAVRDYLERAATPGAEPVFEVQGNIRRFEEVDEPTGQSGALDLDLVVTRDGTVVLQRSYMERESAEKRNPEAVAAALSRALGRILDRMVRDLPTTAAALPNAGPTPEAARSPARTPPHARRSEAR
jgi:ABC-type uncharacterized transport system auxiliary subunit